MGLNKLNHNFDEPAVFPSEAVGSLVAGSATVQGAVTSGSLTTGAISSTSLGTKALSATSATISNLTATAPTITAGTFTKPVLGTAVFSAAAMETVFLVNGGLNFWGAAWSDYAGVWYFNQSSGPWSTFNVSNSTGNLLNTMAIGQSVTQVALLTQTGTGYFPTTFTVDSAAATVKWAGGTAPTASTNAIDALTLTLIKTGSSTFILLGSATKYA